ncbi:hypothetical protein HRJ34_21150 [Rhizorhabdus wittichii]|uniref:VapC45 PIN like domain-containing protein n=1 Tax=Rhizorhabdus wittichii TaxID=160791 RepID=A0A975HCX5_9SPHN|nr:hypothetical protein HRJ34_21150 [Rhizorhabdus wittichii]
MQAVNQIALGEGFELTSVLKEGFKGSTDVHWITAFAADGGEAILTADTDFLKQPPQVQAVERTGVRVIHLPSAWANASRAIQAGHLMIWWQRIEAQLKAMKPRECYTTPFSISDAVSLKKIAIDFQGMNKKVKKAQRASRIDPNR